MMGVFLFRFREINVAGIPIPYPHDALSMSKRISRRFQLRKWSLRLPGAVGILEISVKEFVCLHVLAEWLVSGCIFPLWHILENDE